MLSEPSQPHVPSEHPPRRGLTVAMQLDQLHMRIAQLPAQLTCDDSDAVHELRVELHELIIKLKVRPAGTKGRVWDRACRLLRQLEEKAPCGHPECSSAAANAERAVSRRVVGLTAAGPASLGYERIDAAGHLTRLAKPEDYPDDEESESVRTVSGGLSGLGRRRR